MYFLLPVPTADDPGTLQFNFYGRVGPSGLRRTDGRLKRGTHGLTVYFHTRVKSALNGLYHHSEHTSGGSRTPKSIAWVHTGPEFCPRDTRTIRHTPVYS